MFSAVFETSDMKNYTRSGKEKPSCKSRE